VNRFWQSFHLLAEADNFGAPVLQVDAMLNKQADAAMAYIGESIEVLSGYHYTFNRNYGIACRNLQQDAETFKGQAARPWEEIKSSLGFVSLAEPFLTTLFPSLGAVGGIAVSSLGSCHACLMIQAMRSFASPGMVMDCLISLQQEHTILGGRHKEAIVYPSHVGRGAGKLG